MTTGDLSADAPATDLFPQFGDQLYEMISSEVHGLTDEQLDFETDRWEWSKWSIRRNLSHMASGDMRWLWLRWGTELFPGGLPAGLDIDAIIESPNDRRLDESRYWALDDILGVLRQGLDFARSVLSGETVASMRSREIVIGAAVFLMTSDKRVTRASSRTLTTRAKRISPWRPRSATGISSTSPTCTTFRGLNWPRDWTRWPMCQWKATWLSPPGT